MNFNDFYDRQTSYFSSEHSGGMAECLESYSIKPCVALDIGAGEGRNSLYLSSKGFDVIAVEPSSVGAKKIIDNSVTFNTPVKVIASDFLSVADRLANVGLVIALTSLEHMDYEYMISSLAKIKDIMILGGHIYAMVFTEEDPGFNKSVNASECSAFIKHYFKKNELKKSFSDFEILEYAEYVKEDTAHGQPHFHGKAKLFAKKR